MTNHFDLIGVRSMAEQV